MFVWMHPFFVNIENTTQIPLAFVPQNIAIVDLLARHDGSFPVE